MEVRSADKATDILNEQIDTLAASGTIPAPAVQTLKDAAKDAAVQGKTRADAANVQAYINDRKFYYGVLLILGLAVLISAIGGLLISFYSSKEIPQFIVAIGTTALGAVAGILAPSPTGK